MTERTVVVEVTETEEQTFNVCDHCGLEVKGDGVTLLPIETMDAVEEWENQYGEDYSVITDAFDELGAKVVKPASDGVFHYHADCLSAVTLSEPPEAPRWTEVKSLETSEPIRFAFSGGMVVIMALGMVLAALGIYGFMSGHAFTGPAAIILGFAAMAAPFRTAYRDAQRPAERLRLIGQ